jgi:flagellar protein FliO/FliZ
MPSTARIAILTILLLMPGILRAQTSYYPPAKQSQGCDSDRPAWLDTPQTNHSEPIQIAAPLPPVDRGAVPTNFEEQSSGDRQHNNVRSAESISPSTDSISSSRDKKQAVPLTPQNKESRIPLTPADKGNTKDSAKKNSGTPSMVTVCGCLGVVLGIFLLIAWIFRRAAPQSLARLPSEAFEVLGRAPLAGRQNVHLLRCGNKLLLVSITPSGTETLTEITEPAEVDRLAGLCHQAGSQSSTAAFRQIFEQLAPKRPMREAFSRNQYVDYFPQENEMPDSRGWEHGNV